MVTEPSSHRRSQYVVLASVSAAVSSLAGILHVSGSPAFRPFFGDVNPLAAVLGVAALAAASLGVLFSRGWFDIYDNRKLRTGVLLSATLATLLAIPTILVDISVPFRVDMNVPPPESLLFYPVMGYVAETVFHLLPLSLLLLAQPLAVRHVSRETALWSCVILVSFIEPLFQLAGVPSAKQPAWANAYVGVHIYVFNALQLYVFKRYDFLSMYAFRLVYYLHWHIVWGYVRLQLLF
jgi:hypothetical protein